MDIVQEIKSLEPELIKLRRDFHAHPELGFQEFRTAGIVEEYLRGLGLRPERVAGTGVCALIQGGSPDDSSEEALMLRADMDALPIQELSDIPYRSQVPGVMHACGHDGHTAILLGAARILCRIREKEPELLPGTIKLVFQPNEEIAGAEEMIREGVLDKPKVGAALGLHLWTPLKSGLIGLKAGMVMAAMESFTITVKGRGGHTSYPEQAVDPVLAAASLILESQRLQTRDISLMRPTVIMFGKILGGSQNNIIPDSVTLEGTIRYVPEDVFLPAESAVPAKPALSPPERFKEFAENLCRLHGCRCDIEMVKETTGVINDPGLVRCFRRAAAETAGGAENLVEHVSMAGEDFSAYAARVPSVFAFIGACGGEASSYPHHNPRFNIDESSLAQGVEFMVRSCLQWFAGRH